MSRARVLIVDDDEAVRESLHDELVGEYDVETASGGREALERLAHAEYDVVISDLRMPGVGGIEVLERVHGLQPEAVRVLLTGFLDDEARAATLREDAPFKIGKPWHGTIEVTLKRALEHRETTRRLTRQLGELGRLDDQLAHAEGVVGIADVLVTHLAGLDDIAQVAVTTELAGTRRDLQRRVARPGWQAASPWSVDVALAADGGVRLEVTGTGAGTRAFVLALAERARRWFIDTPAMRLAAAAGNDDRARIQLLAMARRADLGAMSASVLHELASLLQHFSTLAEDLEPLAVAHLEDPEIVEAVKSASEASRRILLRFRHLRSFLSGKPPTTERLTLLTAVEHAVILCRGFAQPRTLELAVRAPDAEVNGDLALLTQVVVNLLRNAVDATERHGRLRVELWREGDEVCLAVTDDGPGVPEHVRARLFVPFATTKDPGAGTGLGLALSAMIVREHGGQLVHVAPAEGGARFVVRLPGLAKGEGEPT